MFLNFFFLENPVRKWWDQREGSSETASRDSRSKSTTFCKIHPFLGSTMDKNWATFSQHVDWVKAFYKIVNFQLVRLQYLMKLEVMTKSVRTSAAVDRGRECTPKIAFYIVCWRELTILLCVRAACTQCSKSHTKPLKCHTKPQSIQELTLPLRLFKNFKFNKKPEAWPTGSLHRTSLLKRHFLALCILS